jgi:hypothetical protein
MKRLFVPTDGPSDWRRLLADPGKQWRASKSAYEAAVAWESARQKVRGLPEPIEKLFDSAPEFRGARLLLGVPEHQVPLDGGGHSSQTDFWALLDAPATGVASVAVEAKAGESFDVVVREWLVAAKQGSGKLARLKQLCGLLNMSEADACSCRYQLLHRPAVAIIEARRFRLKNAVFLVQAFGDNTQSLQDYQHWARLLGTEATAETLHLVGVRADVRLWIGWSGSETASDRTVRDAV